MDNSTVGYKPMSRVINITLYSFEVSDKIPDEIHRKYIIISLI